MKDIEFESALAKFRVDVRSSRTMMIAFFAVALVSRFIFKVPIPYLVIFTLFVWFLLYFIYELWIKKARTTKQIYDIYFRYNIGDLLFLTFIIHFLGGAAWMGAMLYILVLVTAGVILPKKRAISLGFIALAFYSGLVLLEYFGIISHQPIFILEPDIYQSFSYVGVQILVISAIFYFVAETAGTFSEMLRETTEQLKKAYQKTEEAREILEVKVKARTRELERLANTREEIIQERTKELQGKIKELERFQKLAVGRELKMIELKKKLKGQ